MYVVYWLHQIWHAFVQELHKELGDLLREINARLHEGNAMHLDNCAASVRAHRGWILPQGDQFSLGGTKT